MELGSYLLPPSWFSTAPSCPLLGHWLTLEREGEGGIEGCWQIRGGGRSGAHLWMTAILVLLMDTRKPVSILHLTDPLAGSESEPVSPQDLSGPVSEGTTLRPPCQISAWNQASRFRFLRKISFWTHFCGWDRRFFFFFFNWPRSSPWRSKKQNVPKDQNFSPTAPVWRQRRGSGFKTDCSPLSFFLRVPATC